MSEAWTEVWTDTYAGAPDKCVEEPGDGVQAGLIVFVTDTNRSLVSTLSGFRPDELHERWACFFPHDTQEEVLLLTEEECREQFQHGSIVPARNLVFVRAAALV